jgi:hypothetical protein
MALKVPERLDRPTFWQWAVCLAMAHIVLTLLTAAGGAFGAVDSLAIIALALVVGARFRDIGWPVWIGPTFMLVTMLALPLVATGYAIANHLGTPEFLTLMNSIGLLVGPANLLLLIVAGSVPGTAVANSTEASAPVVAPEPSALASDITTAPALEPSQASEEAPVLPSAAPAASDSKGILVLGGGALIILLIMGTFFVRTYSPAPVSTYSAAPVNTARPNPPVGYVQSNGLTKETNDFLQQLSRQPPARR